MSLLYWRCLYRKWWSPSHWKHAGTSTMIDRRIRGVHLDSHLLKLASRISYSHPRELVRALTFIAVLPPRCTRLLVDNSCNMPHQVLGYRKRWKITLQALHIPGVLNVIADRLSRKGQMHQSEWSLHPSVFKLICKKLYTPMVDAFATADNTFSFSSISARFLIHMPTLWMLSAGIGHSFPSMRFPLQRLSKKSSASSLISLLLFAGEPRPGSGISFHYWQIGRGLSH